MDKSKIKIACIYNMNNNMFTLLRFLKDEGYDVDLLLMNEPEHFQPQSDTFRQEYSPYIKQLNWMPMDFWQTGKTPATKSSIKKDLEKYKILIACGYAPSFIAYAGRIVDFFIPYGSDFYHVPFVDFTFEKNGSIADQYPRYQRTAIEECRNIVFDYTTEQEPVFKKFNLKGKRHFIFPPVFYSTDFNKNNISKFYAQSNLYPIVKKLRDENELIIIQHSRQSWKNPEDRFSNKRNDILLEAFSIFKKTHPNLKTKLLLLEYGIDVEASKKMINELNIYNDVVWLPKSYRKEIFVVLSLCDIGVAELGLSFLMYGTVGEFMTMNLPFLLYCKEEDFSKAYPELYPINNSYSVETTVQHLNKFIESPTYYTNRANQTKLWFDKYIINQPIKHITKLIDDIAKRSNYFNFFKK